MNGRFNGHVDDVDGDRSLLSERLLQFETSSGSTSSIGGVRAHHLSIWLGLNGDLT